jgi:hypothetical protein
MNRLAEFRVEHPNLNTPPENRRVGKRRFVLNKNNNPADFHFNNQPERLEKLSKPSFSPTTQNDPIQRLKEILKQKDMELKTLKEITQNFNYLKDDPKRKFLSPQPQVVLRNRLSREQGLKNEETAEKNVFFSKSKPKVIETYPIVGYPTRSLSPDKRFVNYGALVFSKSFNR